MRGNTDQQEMEAARRLAADGDTATLQRYWRRYDDEEGKLLARVNRVRKLKDVVAAPLLKGPASCG